MVRFVLWVGAWLAIGMGAAHAELLPTDRAEQWWDASRADRIQYSDVAAAQCKSRNCDSLQVRSCLNDVLKPPVAPSLRSRTLAEITTNCINGFKAKP